MLALTGCEHDEPEEVTVISSDARYSAITPERGWIVAGK